MKHLIYLLAASIILLSCGTANSNSSESANANSAANATDTLPSSFFRKYSGTIGDLPIVIDLSRSNEKITGSYYYTKIGVPITLEGSIKKDGSFEINEYGNGSVTGTLEGIIPAKGGISGSWKNANENKTLPLSLTEITEGFAQVTFEDRNAKNCKLASKDMDMNGSEDGCTTLNAHFLTVQASSPEVSAKINTTLISNNAVSSYTSEKINTLDDLMKSVNIDTPEEGFNAEISYEVETNQNNVICISTSSTWYGFGAAHPDYGVTYTNFDLRNGNIIQLEELLNPGFEKEINRIAEANFIKENGSEGWDFEPGNFALNRNFAIHPGGLLFTFNPYEIGTYVAGAPSVFVSYKSIAKLINQNGLLASWNQ